MRALLRNPITVLRDKLSPRRRLLRRYVADFERLPRLDPPVGFNEHMIHRLLYDRDPRLKVMCDKIAVKKLVTNRVGAEYAVPLLGAWRRAEEITWESLPESFVLKPNYTSGPFVAVESRATLDVPALTNEARKWLRTKPRAFLDCEWGYRGIPRYLMAEPLLRGPGGQQALEICVYTFHGRAAVIRALNGRKFTDERHDAWFDLNGRQLALKTTAAKSFRMNLDPTLRDKVVTMAEALSDGMSSLRVDFLVGTDGPRVGELTPYSWGGRARWEKPEMDEMMGRLFISPDTSFIPSLEPEAG